MITGKQIQDILSLYQKHGWKLRRVLLSKQLKASLAETVQTVFKAEIVEAEIDAVWFSRASGKESEAWELRRLSETPYALLEVFEADDEEEIREETRQDLEKKLTLAN